MTAIAYRAGVLAADTAGFIGNMIVGFSRKIARGPDGRVAGATGDAAIGDSFLDAVERGEEKEWQVPTGTKPEDFAAVVVMPDEVIYEVVDTGYHNIAAPFFAIGSAYEFLMGAMAAGASAEEAVRLAIKHTRAAGGEVHVERLGDQAPLSHHSV